MDNQSCGVFSKCVPGHSSTETEFISAYTGARNLMWMSRLADEMLIPMPKQVANLIIDNKLSIKYNDGEIVPNEANNLHLLVDKKGAYDIANSYGPSKRTKHMQVRHHYLQYLINNKKIRITLVPTTEQWVDFLTKKSWKNTLQIFNDKHRLPDIENIEHEFGGLSYFL